GPDHLGSGANENMGTKLLQFLEISGIQQSVIKFFNEVSFISRDGFHKVYAGNDSDTDRLVSLRCELIGETVL
ncbi:MAG TPA: hypothetical protein DCM60_01615, partial [Nitrospina sp.]|nr:hypothetical protein [Nitrospina sp.]